MKQAQLTSEERVQRRRDSVRNANAKKDYICLRPTPEEGVQIRAFAAMKGVSMAQYIMGAVKTQMTKDRDEMTF